MGYSLYGFVAKRGTFDAYRLLDQRISVARLNGDFDLLLNCEYLYIGLQLGKSESPQGFDHWLLTTALLARIFEQAKQTPFAYVCSDYLGGTGLQKAAVWGNGALLMKHQTPILPWPHSIGPVNNALRMIGVVAEGDKDEFLTLGLNRNRQMEYWFEECTGISHREYLQDLDWR